MKIYSWQAQFGQLQFRPTDVEIANAHAGSCIS